jgi:PAS domain S-box-containing protein
MKGRKSRLARLSCRPGHRFFTLLPSLFTLPRIVRRQQPFNDLRALLQDVQDVLEHDSLDAGRRADGRAVFEKLQGWIASAEERKRKSDSVIDAALDAVVAIDAAGVVEEWNREAERMFGWKREQVLGQRLSELIIPLRYRAAHEKGLQRFMKTGKGPMLNRRTELVAIRRDGKEFPVEITILEPVVISGKQIVHAFVRDISDRRQAETAIRGSEALYHSLVDSLPISVIRKDLDGRLTFANRTYCELLGRSVEDLLGKTDYDLFPREIAEKFVRDDQHVAATGRVFHDIEKNVADGKTRYFEVYKVPVFGGDRKVLETQAIFWDVTDRVETREALAHERDLLRTLMDHLPDLVYVKDLQSHYVTGNIAQAELLGLGSPAELQGKTAHDFFPAEQADVYAGEDQSVISTGEPIIDREERFTDRLGRVVWLSTSKVPIHGRDGSVQGLVGIDRNITKRKLAEDELKRSNRELDEFVSVVTHDLQAPLRAVSSYCKLLQKEAEADLDEEEREFLREALAGVTRMQKLIESLRSYARATEKKHSHAPVDLGTVLDQALDNLEVEIREQAAVITHDPLPTVPGDATQLMQLFQNLIANGIKYCRGRQPEVHLGAEQLGNEWHLWVRDNGIGIEPAQLHDVFRIFQRLHADESEFAGTGIGLAVCKRIVERHHGSIWVESTPGKGSTFHFTLASEPRP